MYEKALEMIDRNMKELEWARLEIASLPEMEFANFHHSGGCSSCLIGSMPYNTETLKLYRAKLEAAGWSFTRETLSTQDGVLCVDFHKPGALGYLQIQMRPQYAGSTCKLNVIGYEQKPIYEVTCQDAPAFIGGDIGMGARF